MIESILWILFTLICIIVSGVILLQEGKGGGLGEAFGGAGQQTFGVKAEGIAKFTGYMSIALIVIALVISIIRKDESVFPKMQPTAPAPMGDPTQVPMDGPVAPPAGDGATQDDSK